MINQTTKSGDDFETYDVVIAGAGVSGLTAANILTSAGAKVLVMEKDAKPGGLIRCESIKGNLHHLVGGHVFNTKLPAVSDFFWNSICKKSDFAAASREAKILINGKLISYPIENNLGSLGRTIAGKVINELLDISKSERQEHSTFRDFLLGTFGQTLCELYFLPYNRKIWQLDPQDMAIEWLAGKLPMPAIPEVLLSNIIKTNDTGMVHDHFFYPRINGSQHIVSSLMNGLDVRANTALTSIEVERDGRITINKQLRARFLIYTGSARDLPQLLAGDLAGAMLDEKTTDGLRSLKSHGTTNLLCSCEPSSTSWTYLPEPTIKAHRIINTGLFSTNNTSDELKEKDLSTCVLEFSGHVSASQAAAEMKKVSTLKDIISYNYRKSTYVMHDLKSKETILRAKEYLSRHNIFLLGRFGEWEYYNMDTAMQASITTAKQIAQIL